ncbi:MAG: hypothetical protein Kow00127_12390 [Bacteroidales bacterium]
MKARNKYLIPAILWLLLVTGNNGFTQYTRFGDFLTYGRQALQEQKYVEALNYLNRALETRPASAEAWYLRGVAKYFMNDLTGAEQDFTQAALFDPYRADIFHMRAICRSRLFNIGGALKDYNRAVLLNPKNADYWVNRARVWIYDEQWDKAIADCTEALKLEKELADGYMLLGAACSGKKQYDSALMYITRAIELKPEEESLYIQRGGIRMEMHQPDSAIADFNKALAIDSLNEDALLNRAMALMEQNRTNEALNDLDQVIDINPANSFAWYNRAILRLKTDNPEGALEDLDAVLALNPDNIMVLLFKGKILAAGNKLRRAVEAFSEAIRIWPDFADAWWERAQVRKQMGDINGAESDEAMAWKVGQRSFTPGDTLSLEKQMILRRMFTLRGGENRFGSDNRQPINPVNPFRQLYYGILDNRLIYYDSFGKKGYQEKVLVLTSSPPSGHTTPNGGSDSTVMAGQPDTVLSNYLAGLKEFEGQNYLKAEQLFNLAVKESPGFVPAWLGKANALIAIADMAETGSGDYFLSAPGLPDHPDMEVDVDSIYRAAGECLDIILKIDKEFYPAWFNKGWIETRRGNYWMAVHYYSRALELKPRFAEASYNKGLILIFQQLKAVGCNDIRNAAGEGFEPAFTVLQRFCY